MTATESKPVKHQRQKRWRDRNPIEAWAHSATQSALRCGIIQPEPCAVCGESKTEAHHPDYLRPLHVEWHCRKHNRAVHYRKTGA